VSILAEEEGETEGEARVGSELEAGEVDMAEGVLFAALD